MDSYRIIKGENHILISAPHSSMHKRKNSIRTAETRTGQLARNIAKSTKSYSIYKTKPEMNDANWDKKSEYKNATLSLVKENDVEVLLDIHGMASYREQDICVGINGGKNIKNRLDIVKKMTKVFNKYGFKNVSIDEPFSASNSNCISTYTAQKCNIMAFQIEINRKYRSSSYKEFAKYKDLEKAFIEICKILMEV